MAPFNPEIRPTEAPNYLGLSRSISQPQADTSFETLLKGIGDTVEIAVKGTDQAIKQNIQNEIFAAVDAERGSFTNALETVSGKNKPLNILSDEEKRNLPSELNEVASTTRKLSSALRSGKISKTYYLQQLNSMAKDFRSRYPGYREYIDNQISSITGVNPANAYMTSLMADINKASEMKDQQLKDTLSLLKQNIEIPGADKVYNKVFRGELSAEEGMAWVSERLSFKHQVERFRAEREIQKGTKEQLQDRELSDFTYEAGVTLSNQMDNIRVVAGNRTVKEMIELTQKHANGEIQIPDEQFTGLAQALRAGKAQYISAMLQAANERYKDGTTRMYRMGGKAKFDDVLSAQLTAYDEIIKNIEDKNFGLAATNAAFVKARNDTTKANILRDASLGGYFTMLNAVKDLGGEQYIVNHFHRLLSEPVSDDVKEWLKHQSMQATSQADPRKQGGTFTLNDALDQAEHRNISRPQVYQFLIKRIDDLTRKDVPDGIKVNLLRHFFDPEAAGTMARFNVDSTDENGRPIPGRYSAFSKLTSPEVTREIKRLSQNDQSLWTRYTNWAENTFANDMYTKDIRSIQGMFLPKGAKVTWNDQTNRFGLIFNGKDYLQPGTGRPDSRYAPLTRDQSQASFTDTLEPASQTFNIARRTLNRINGGLSTLSNIAKENNQNVSVYLLGLMLQTGFNPRAGNNVSIPDDIAKALYGPIREQGDKELKKKMNGDRQ